jgi:hypothetical protein
MPKIKVLSLLIILTFVFSGLNRAGDLVTEVETFRTSGQQENVLYIPYTYQGKKGEHWSVVSREQQNRYPKIDGVLDEEIWQRAAVLDTWKEFPMSSTAESKTKMRIIADNGNIYIGAEVKVPGFKEEMLKKANGKDQYGGPLIDIFFDPGRKGEEKFQIASNPIGLRYDAHNSDAKWDGTGFRKGRVTKTWRSAGTLTETGFIVELAIRIDTLKRPAIYPGHIYKANFCWVDGAERMFSWTGKWGSPKTDYGKIIFGSKEDVKEKAKVGIGLVLDREIYDLRDSSAIGIVDIDAESVPKESMSIKLSIKQQEKVIVSQIIKSPQSGFLGLTIDMKDIPAGDYTALIQLFTDDKLRAESSDNFTRKKRILIPEGKKEGRISIKVPASEKGSGIAWPISTGVPFAQGVLNTKDNVRLVDSEGKEVPCQTGIRCRWNKGGSIRWLGFDFVPVVSGIEQQYFIEYGPSVKRKKMSGITCRETSETISIDTGKMKFNISRRNFKLLENLYLDSNGDKKYSAEELVISESAAGGLFLIDHEGSRYESVNDRKVKVVIEEKGDRKVTVKAEGWYVKTGSKGEKLSCELPTDKLCKFAVRLTAYAGQALIKAETTTVITYDTSKVRIKGLGINLKAEGVSQLTFGIKDSGALVWDKNRLAGNPYLLQNRWDKNVDEKGNVNNRASGWLELEGKNAVIQVCVKNLWQRFPKEIEWHNNSLNIHIWPAHGFDTFPMDDQVKMKNIYKLWYTHQGKELDFRFPAKYTTALDDELKRKPGSFRPYYKSMEWSNGQGVAIHNEFVLSFKGKEQQAPETEIINSLLENTFHAVPDPEYICATGALGPLLHADKEFADMEKRYSKGFDHMVTRPEINNEYGQFIFRGTHTYWYYRGKESHAGIHRVWQNGHYFIQQLPLVQYMRTGDPKWLKWGRDHIDTVRDIAVVHYESDERRFRFHSKGAMYHCKGFAPWAGDSGITLHMAVYTFLAYDYYINGNKRSLDVLHEWIEGLKKLNPGGHSTREGMVPLGEMVEAYRITWDPELLDYMDKFSKAIFYVKDPHAAAKGNPMWDFNPFLLIRYHELTGDRKALAVYREVLAGKGLGVYHGGGMQYDPYLAMLDNDKGRLNRYLKNYHAESIRYIDNPGTYCDGLSYPVWINYVYKAHKYPYLLKAMKHFGIKPEMPKEIIPSPLPYEGNVSLVAVRERQDKDITVNFKFKSFPEGIVTAVIYDTAWKKLQDMTFKPTEEKPESSLIIKADGKADTYFVEIKQEGGFVAPEWPLTDLEQEVFVSKTGNFRLDPPDTGVRYYCTGNKELPAEIGMLSNSKRTAVVQIADSNEKIIGKSTYGAIHAVRQPVKIPKNANYPLSFFATAEKSIDLYFRHVKPIFVSHRKEGLFMPKINKMAGGK